jgi:hypothetical protein
MYVSTAFGDNGGVTRPPPESTDMTVAEYMSPQRFPLTTQPGLRPDQQMMIDSVNYDELNDNAGGLLTPEEEQIARELDEKNSARAEIMAQLGGPSGPPASGPPGYPAG